MATNSPVMTERPCTLLLAYDSPVIKESDFIEQLESKDEAIKLKALKDVIAATLHGEVYPKLMMAIIKYCLHTENHLIKKCLLMYWEIIEKKNPQTGQLLSEMILICNAIKNNLTHPNEYIRGSTLRFLCKIKESEILESLISSVTENLTHRHSYVRKNAIWAVYSIWTVNNELIPDAAELVETFLYAESNVHAKRNAFLALFWVDKERAIHYLNTNLANVPASGDAFQLVLLENVRRICRTHSELKGNFIRTIFSLVNSSSPAVSYEGANTLISLSHAPTAIRAAVTAYKNLLNAQSENNVKLVILDRVIRIRKLNEKIVEENLMDIMRNLSTPNEDLRKKILGLTLDLLNPNNVSEIVKHLKTELSSIESQENLAMTSKNDSYLKLLMDTLHQSAVKFPSVVSTVTHALLNYISDDNQSVAIDVIYFVKEIMEEYPSLREEIINKLLSVFSDIRITDVYRITLWILGEYSLDNAVIETILSTIRESIGPLPLTSKSDAPPTNFRSFLLNGDYFLAACLANTVTKIVLRYSNSVGLSTPEVNVEIAQALLLLVSLLRYGQSSAAVKTIDPDSYQRIMLCIRTLLDPQWGKETFTTTSRELYSSMLRDLRARAPKVKEPQSVKEVDELITIRQLQATDEEDGDLDNEEGEFNIAVGQQQTVSSDVHAKLDRVYQLTGFSDPVYAEASLCVQNYDIMLDILIVNMTQTTLQNLTLELHASGDLKVVERPAPMTLGSLATTRLNATIRLSSTESGVIFGNLVYDNSSGTHKTIVMLSNIHMDIMDYISPATCSDSAFREMWAEFEWENKVAVNTDVNDLNAYLQHIAQITNMNCLTPDSTLSGECNFLAANLYAKSIFNEDALLNLSVEKQKSGKVSGYIRIRSKTQGIALSLGDKITAKQRKT